jgi:selenocysteine-specific elongation factor
MAAEMSRNLIMGTAGHVDHGKTALVRLLTGIDTDRLKEERERGISIELGFAHLDLPSGQRVGVVDVPGHEKFVKHMLAGAGGIDFVLLVVAADEGVMPQTIEHSQIVELLGVTRGLVALTKVDMVDPELMDLVEEDVRDYLDASPTFAGWPILRVSSITGEGKDRLIEAIDHLAASVPTRPGSGTPRLPIDRVFTMEGFGTVVTGTLWRGTVSEGQQVVVDPGGRAARVRQVQVHGRRVQSAQAGQRVALALHGLAKDDVARGDWVSAPGAMRDSSILDVRLRAVEAGKRTIRQRERVRFHLGATEVFGRVTLFGREELGPGEDDVAQIRLEHPIVAERGDRFVIRWYSPTHTAGGGQVIEGQARKRRRSDIEAAAALAVLERGSVAERVLAALSARPASGLVSGLTMEELVTRTGASPAEVAAAVAELTGEGRVGSLGAGRLVSEAHKAEIVREIEGAAADYQARFPLRFGIPRGEVRSRLAGMLRPEAVDAAIEDLVAGGRVFVRDDRVRFGAPFPNLPPELREVADRFKRTLEAAAYSVPTAKEAMTGAGAGSWPAAQELLVYLAGAGEIVRLGDDLAYTREQLARLEAEVTDVLLAKGMLTVADFKEKTGVSRKYAVPLLEYLDGRGVTRRSGDNRVPGRALAGKAGAPG